ncbi:MAG: hypothetical protein H7Z42_22160, partial [Roseiflexaceae bacterium]|nr:hypothetical protein [Roseiflexaceae bacterium]
MNTNDTPFNQPAPRAPTIADRAAEDMPVATPDTEYVVLAPSAQRRPRAVVVG